jgi:hypothetical protein
MKRLIIIAILLSGSLSLWSQRYEVKLQVDKPEKISLKLFSDIDGEKLLDLPVTCQLTDKNNLVMIVGNGEYLQNDYCVWWFSSPKKLKYLMKSNKNISSTKKFKRRYSNLNMFYDISDNKMQYIRDYEFDNGYEIVSRNPKPVFFKIDKNAKETELSLTLFVSKPDKKFRDLFFARAKTVELNIKIKN